MSIHIPTQADLYNIADPLIGLRVRLDRTVDRQQPCHDNIAEVCNGKGPHAYALLCEACGRHRGWLPKKAVDFIVETIRAIGIPQEPIVYRDQNSAVAGADGEITQAHRIGQGPCS